MITSKTKSAIQWENPDKSRPQHGEKIIVTCTVGLYWGKFYYSGSGVVHIENRSSDAVAWDEVFQWISYPVEF